MSKVEKINIINIKVNDKARFEVSVKPKDVALQVGVVRSELVEGKSGDHYVETLDGVRLSLFANRNFDSNLNGLELALLSNDSRHVRGLQLSLGINVADSVDGWQGSLYGNQADNVNGLQSAIVVNDAMIMRGAQTAVVANVTGIADGAQLAVVGNQAVSVFGGQWAVGLNVADELKGVQAGLVDHSGKSWGILGSYRSKKMSVGLFMVPAEEEAK
jgi:hypothetical protein